jgi:hypothetical protein
MKKNRRETRRFIIQNCLFDAKVAQYAVDNALRHGFLEVRIVNFLSSVALLMWPIKSVQTGASVLLKNVSSDFSMMVSPFTSRRGSPVASISVQHRAGQLAAGGLLIVRLRYPGHGSARIRCVDIIALNAEGKLYAAAVEDGRALGCGLVVLDAAERKDDRCAFLLQQLFDQRGYRIIQPVSVNFSRNALYFRAVSTRRIDADYVPLQLSGGRYGRRRGGTGLQ